MIKIEKERGGFTLIELLIVVAIIAIMVVGVGNTFFYVFQNQAELRLQFPMQQSANLVMESVALDVARSQNAVIETANVAIFRGGSDRTVTYSTESGSLLRTIETGGEKKRQVLAEDVKTFELERSGGLLKIHLVLEKKRYRKTFSEDYQTAFAIDKGE